MFDLPVNDSNNVDVSSSQKLGSNNLNIDSVNALNISSKTSTLSGLYTVGASGVIKTDFEFDGGAYKSEVAVIRYKDLENYQPGSEDFNKEVAKRALSNSVFGHIITSERIESGQLSGGTDNYSTGEYSGEKSFQMTSNDQIFIAIAPNTTFQQIYDNPDITGLYSLKEANPDGAEHIAKVNVGNSGIIFGIEDIRLDGKSDRDFNDAVIKFQGIVGDASPLKDLLNPNNSWWDSENGQKILNENLNVIIPPIDPPVNRPVDPPVNPPVNPPLPYKNGDLVKGSDETKIYLIESNRKHLIPNPGILREYDLEDKRPKTLTDEELNKIISGDNLLIPTEYQQSANVTNDWRSDFYWWDEKNGTPSLDFSSNSNNKFASLNLGSNTGTGAKKGINFDWGAGSPKGDSKLLNDNFAITAYTEATFDGGTYNFQASGDDGFQVFVKKKGTDELKYLTPKDKWQQAYGSPWKTETTLQGNYEVYFTYYEERGDAKFNLSWEKKAIVPPTPTLPHKYEFTYFFNGENKDGSDYYTGWVFAEPGKTVNSYVNPNPNNNETGKDGIYLITKDAGEGKADDINKVFVDRYYDSETNTNYAPVKFSKGEPSSTNGLGSEYDFIGTENNINNDFGKDEYTFSINPKAPKINFSSENKNFTDDKLLGLSQITGSWEKAKLMQEILVNTRQGEYKIFQLPETDFTKEKLFDVAENPQDFFGARKDVNFADYLELKLKFKAQADTNTDIVQFVEKDINSYSQQLVQDEDFGGRTVADNISNKFKEFLDKVEKDKKATEGEILNKFQYAFQEAVYSSGKLIYGSFKNGFKLATTWIEGLNTFKEVFYGDFDNGKTALYSLGIQYGDLSFSLIEPLGKLDESFQEFQQGLQEGNSEKIQKSFEALLDASLQIGKEFLEFWGSDNVSKKIQSESETTENGTTKKIKIETLANISDIISTAKTILQIGEINQKPEVLEVLNNFDKAYLVATQIFSFAEILIKTSEIITAEGEAIGKQLNSLEKIVDKFDSLQGLVFDAFDFSYKEQARRDYDNMRTVSQQYQDFLINLTDTIDFSSQEIGEYLLKTRNESFTRKPDGSIEVNFSDTPMLSKLPR